MVLLAMVGLPAWIPLPFWMQTSAIGCVWGGLVLLGLDCAWSHRRLWSAFAVGLAILMAQFSIRSMTDLEHHAGWLVVLSVVSGGWLLGHLLMRTHATDLNFSQYSRYLRNQYSISHIQREAEFMDVHEEEWDHGTATFSLWDIACLMTIISAACWVLPRIENQFDLLCRVGPAMIGGLVMSGIAIQWASHDRWSVLGLVFLVLAGLAALGLCLWSMPVGFDLPGVLVWLVAGPLSVMSAQALTVLAFLATCRSSAGHPS